MPRKQAKSESVVVSYQALQTPSQESSPDVDTLLHTLARIEARRRSEQQKEE